MESSSYTKQLCLSQFATALGFPVLIVAANKLGALNHTQLTVYSIAASKAVCLGVVLSEPEQTEENPAHLTNRGVLEELLEVPVLGEIEHGATALVPGMAERILAMLSPAPHVS